MTRCLHSLELERDLCTGAHVCFFSACVTVYVFVRVFDSVRKR